MSVRWSPFVKQLVTIISLVFMAWLFIRLRDLWVPLILAMLLAYMVSFPVTGIVRRTGWRRGPVVALVLLIVVLSLGAVSVLVVPSLVNLLRSFGNTLVGVVQNLLGVTPKPIAIGPAWTIDLGPYYSPINEWLRALIEPNLSMIQNIQRLFFPFASGAAIVVIGAVNGVIWGVLILVVSFYLMIDASHFLRVAYEGMPARWRPELAHLYRELAQIWDAFVRGRLILGVLMGLMVWLSLAVLGVRNAAALGLVAGVLELVPVIGPTVAAVPGILIALFLGSSWLPLANSWFALLVAGVYILLSQLENLYLHPLIVGRRIQLHPVAIIIGAVAGAELGGVLGVFLAAPVIAALRVLAAYTFRKLLDEEPFPAPRPQPDRRKLWAARAAARPVRAVLFDLDGTLIETDDAMVQQITRRLRFLGWLVPEERRGRFARRWLMANEGLANRAISVLNRLRLDGLLSRIDGKLRRWQGFHAPTHFVMVQGCQDMLPALARRYPLAVVTMREREDAAAFMAEYGLNGLFSAIVSRDDVSRLKPHPMPLLKAAGELGVPPEQCVMVGDTTVDMQAAKAAGALAVGVLCGFGDENDLRGADLVLESTAQLREWLEAGSEAWD